MKFSIRICFLHLFITLAWVETNTSAGLRKNNVKKLQTQVKISGKGRKVDSPDNKIVKDLTRGVTESDDYRDDHAKSWKTDHNKSHLQAVNSGKGIPCVGKPCLRSSNNVAKGRRILRNEQIRNRRTESVFLAKALDMLDHSKPRELWNFATRATPNKPYKQFSNGTDTNEHSSNSTAALVNKPVKNQAGKKRQQWSDVKSEMRPRFFFNSAPAEYVEQTPPTVHRPGEGEIHLRQGPIHAPEHLHGMGPFFHGANNHQHMMKHPGHLPPLPIDFLGHPVPQHIHLPLKFNNHRPHLHHFAPPPPYAIHINAPPRLRPPPQPLPPVDVPPPIPPDVLGEQMPPVNPPFGVDRPPPEVHVMPPPNNPIHSHPPIEAPITTETMPPDFSVMPPPDIPVSQHPIDIQGMPPPGDVSPMPPPDIPVQPHPIDIQGMPPPGDVPPMPPPPAIEKVPVPFPVPSPPKVEHVPYPVPVPGPPSVQPVVFPIRVPSPPKIQEVRVPVPSPPKINNVPVPFPVAVPSPPHLQRVPYPVAVPIKEPPEIQKIFYPIAVPQPSQVHHVPYPVYIRYPPEIRRVPVAVPSPPKPFPVPVPSPPRLMIHREPYPVLYPQKVPYPIPVVIQHHHVHQEVENGGGN